MPASPTLEPTLCPLCGQANRCAQERERETGEAQGPCWCTQVDFGPALLARVPAEARDQVCICLSCARGAPRA